MFTGSIVAFQRRSVIELLVRQREEGEGLRPKTKTTNTTGGSSQNHHHARAKTKAAHDVIIVNKSNHAAYVSSVKHYDEQMDAPMFHSNVAHSFNHDALAPPVLSTSICYSAQMLRCFHMYHMYRVISEAKLVQITYTWWRMCSLYDFHG